MKEDDNKQHLKVLFDWLKPTTFASTQKCIIGKKQVNFICHLVDAHLIPPLSSHVDAITDFPASQLKLESNII